MSLQTLSYCELGRPKLQSQDSLNSSLCVLNSPLRSHLNKSVRGLFASFGLTPPPSVCSGSREALWFSTKFEKKMAALEDETPSSPLTRFQRSVPLRQSKLTTGPFRATQIWNEVIEHLKEKVELKKRRYKLRNYDDSFTGTDAVDVVLHYLLSDQENFCNLSREKAVKLCQTLMDKKVFQPVGSKVNENGRHHFEDSSSKLYHFYGEHSIKSGDGQTDSEDETEGRNDDCDLGIGDGDNGMSTTTPPEHTRRLNPDTEARLTADDGSSTPKNRNTATSRIHGEVQESRKRKNQILDTSQQSSKRQKVCSSSTESLNEDELSEAQIHDIWKEVALCQLLTKVDLSFLDGILTEEKEKSHKKLMKSSHPSGIVSNIVAKHWSMRCSTRSATHSDPYMKAALEVVAHIPRGISKFDTDFTKSSDPVTKLQAYNMICEHYSGRLDSLIPERFLDLNMAIMQLIFAGREAAALEAMQLNMVLVPEKQKSELQRLLKFMNAVVDETEIMLDPMRVTNNEGVVLTHLTDCILKHKGLDLSYSSVIVQFLVKHVSQVFEMPEGLKEKVDARIKETKTGKVPIVEETVFCNQVPVSEYQKLTEECTNSSLVQMMNTIIDNPKLSLKEKKQRIRQFRKYHPHIYSKHFVGMAE